MFLGHLEGYFENWEKDSKSTEISKRITQISWSISKISVNFFELVVIGAIDWLSGTMVGISGVPDTFLVPNSKFSIGDLMSSIADTNFQIESYQHWLLSVTECPRVSLNCSTRVTFKKIIFKNVFKYLKIFILTLRICYQNYLTI